jgi:hypothetical protein
LHLANYKPILMRRVFAEFLRPEDILCYFDPDGAFSRNGCATA